MISYSNLNLLMCMRLWTLGEGTRSPTMEGQTCFLLEKAATNTCKRTFYMIVRTFKAYSFVTSIAAEQSNYNTIVLILKVNVSTVTGSACKRNSFCDTHIKHKTMNLNAKEISDYLPPKANHQEIFAIMMSIKHRTVTLD